MANRKISERTKNPIRREDLQPAASTPEGRESQLISLAHDLAEQQMRDGTASSQVIAHFLKLGGEKEKLEKERLKQEILLQQAKTAVLKEQKSMVALFESALSAFKVYNGNEEVQ